MNSHHKMSSHQSRFMGRLCGMSWSEWRRYGVFFFAGQSSDYIIDRLTTYKNRGETSNVIKIGHKQACYQSKTLRLLVNLEVEL